tara:strand:+ start:414 stop:587 length:174 start_codon:yes stop_codon:yes gene_type:complete
VLTEEEGSPESKLESPQLHKKDLARKSPPKKLAASLDKFAIKEFTATKGSGSSKNGS